MRIPHPFSRVVMVGAPLIPVPPDADAEELERKHAEMQASLERVRDVAESWFTLSEAERGEAARGVECGSVIPFPNPAHAFNETQPQRAPRYTKETFDSQPFVRLRVLRGFVVFMKLNPLSLIIVAPN